MKHRSIAPGLVQEDEQVDEQVDEQAEKGGFEEAQRGPDCLTADEILELLLGGLPNDKREAALEHIAGCAECRVLLSSAAGALEDTGPATPSTHPGLFQPGVVLANRYCVERFLARGGMGEVYAVRDEVLNEQVALKTLRASPATDDKAIRRLKSEAMLSRRIGHANVCRIFDFGEHEVSERETICFLTMELVEGETLGARLRRAGPLPLEQVSVILRQVLGGLAEAHALGIVHRDLKSDNIMLRRATATTPPGDVPLMDPVDAVVMDFGLALRIDSDERLTSDIHAMIGSAAYMSPEQVEGQRLTAATDVYSLGIILFEMLTGQLPFRAATPVATAMQRLHIPPPLPSTLRPELDPFWDQLVMTCLRRTTAERFPSAKEALAVLGHRAQHDRHGLDSNAAMSSALSTSLPGHRASDLRTGSLAVATSVAALVALWIVAAAPWRTWIGRVQPAAPSSTTSVRASTPAAPAVVNPDPPAMQPPAILPPAILPPAILPPATRPVAPLSAPSPERRESLGREPRPARRNPRPEKPSAERSLPQSSRAATSTPESTPESPREPAKETAPLEATSQQAAPTPPPPSPLEPLPLDPEFPE